MIVQQPFKKRKKETAEKRMISMNNPVLPHRYPFLFIDCVVESEPGKWVKGYKFITENDWFITENQKEMPFSS
ncbi:hypothetical protein CHCC14600_1639 [Bacillus licheniformis]|nr:hypothetical protein AB684_02450 [Bacillus licheniformis]EQM24985.1 hypothetical protein N399_02440 [Bacillus licheniformis CG-B52]KUL08540.1 hypothetical protein LI17339_17590 [Bacillus licheniformis LMG 17339]MSO00344.1 hypothetical protein [Bacillus paralicheniformis]NBB45977.1 hypothetical protein [Bacillus sp. y1(2019)]